MFLPSSFYETPLLRTLLRSLSLLKTLQAASKSRSKKPLLVKNLTRTLLKACCCMTPLVCTLSKLIAWKATDHHAETGRIQFRRVRFQTPNSVNFLGLTEFRGANSASSFQPIICVQTRTHRVFPRTHRVCPKTQ